MQYHGGVLFVAYMVRGDAQKRHGRQGCQVCARTAMIFATGRAASLGRVVHPPETTALSKLRWENPMAVIFDSATSTSEVDGDVNPGGSRIQAVLKKSGHDALETGDLLG